MPIVSLLGVLFGGAVGELPAFAVSARLPAEALVVGEEYVIVLDVEADGEINKEFTWHDPREPGELRRPLLHIDAPDAVELLGAPPASMTTPEDFQVTFLRMPWGRRVLAKQTEIAFRLAAEPADGDVVGLNVVTYLEGEDPQAARFVRQRIELPVAPGAEASGRPSRVSTWGRGETLAIGEAAPDFALEDARGAKKVSLHEDVLGARRALVMAYRRAT